MLGVSQQTVCKYLSGLVIPESYPVVSKAKQVFRIAPDAWTTALPTKHVSPAKPAEAA